jgi:mRNA interferase HigB
LLNQGFIFNFAAEFSEMDIKGATIIEDFCRRHTGLIGVLAKWVDGISHAKWSCHNDLKAEYPTADYIGNKRYVFNLKGNHYRLVVVVVFIVEIVEIRFIGTHAEYDKIKDIENI